jgi:hypothetical protein
MIDLPRVSEENLMPIQLASLPRIFLAAVVFTLPHLVVAQPAMKPLPLHDAIQDKDFFLLSLLQSNSDVHNVLVTDKALGQVSAERQQFLALALQTCKGNSSCILKTLLWTEEEIRTVSFALAQQYMDNPSLRKLVEGDLRPSGADVLYQMQSGEDLLVNAWEVCARGLNNIISVYGQGTAPRYPLIDSISVDINSVDFQRRIASLTAQISNEAATPELFFEPSLKAALLLLELNHRDEAGRMEPMESIVNQAAVRSIPTVQWSNYAYSVIVVPGAGPENRDTPLSDAGRKRTALAADEYHAGKAPFILLSGGYVHPSQTKYAEAVEMKKALLNDYHVPEEAILVDPHARHTTTNMRNAAREIYRYRIPMNKPALVVSNSAQITYIESHPFADRCMKELGYVPDKILKRASDISLVFLPMVESLQQDPLDPLDP